MLLKKELFKKDAVELARFLLGKEIQHNSCSGIIVETEAYKSDPASHAYKITPRSRIMLDSYGRWYIYFVYGMFFCLNITTNEDEPGAVLIRAIQPIGGIEIMEKRRKTTERFNLCSGPGKLCTALGITKELNGTDLNQEISLHDCNKLGKFEVGRSSRIGIKEGKDLLWRFFVRDNPFVSKYCHDDQNQ